VRAAELTREEGPALASLWEAADVGRDGREAAEGGREIAGDR